MGEFDLTPGDWRVCADPDIPNMVQLEVATMSPDGVAAQHILFDPTHALRLAGALIGAVLEMGGQ